MNPQKKTKNFKFHNGTCCAEFTNLFSFFLGTTLYHEFSNWGRIKAVDLLDIRQHVKI